MLDGLTKWLKVGWVRDALKKTRLKNDKTNNATDTFYSITTWSSFHWYN